MSQLTIEVFWNVDSQLGMAQLILAELPPAIWYSAFTGRAENIRFPFLREICFSSCSLFFFLNLFFFFSPKHLWTKGLHFRSSFHLRKCLDRLIWKERPGSVLKDIPSLQVELAVVPRSSEPSREVPLPLWGSFVAGKLDIQLQVVPLPLLYMEPGLPFG